MSLVHENAFFGHDLMLCSAGQMASCSWQAIAQAAEMRGHGRAAAHRDRPSPMEGRKIIHWKELTCVDRSLLTNAYI